MDDSRSSTAMAGSDYALFAAIVTAGSLAGAGRMLGISAPMVSKRLARLEARLATRLVHRTTRRLELTSRGARFHADISAILAAAKEAERRAIGHVGVAFGPLRLSAPTSFGRMHVAPHIGRFLADHPGIDLTLDLSDAFLDLAAARVDVAIRITANVTSDLVAHRLAASRRILCAAPAYLASFGNPKGVEALSGHRLLAAEGQMPWRLIGPEGARTIDAAPVIRTNSSEVVRELALTGEGIALRSLWDINGDLAAGRLVRLLPDWQGSTDVGIYAIHPHGRYPPPAVDALIAFLRDLYKAMPD